MFERANAAFGASRCRPDRVAFVLECPAEDVTWLALPPHSAGIADLLDLDKTRSSGSGVPPAGRRGIT
jgi:hypothetical protein